MSDEETTQPTPEPTQPEPISTPPVENQTSEASPIPVNPDKSTEQAPAQPIESSPTEMPPGPTEPQPSPESTILDKDQNLANEPFPVKDEVSSSHGASEPAPAPEPQLEQNQAPETPQNPPETAPQPPTAQMAGNELLPVSAGRSDEAKDEQRKENLERANAKRQEKKREKINAILDLFAKQTNLTNDEVEKLLHVSDATATRYLEQLEKEGKIKQVGKTGKNVNYIKI